MNLEKDVSPTGLYNYLPKVRTIRRRKPSRRTRKSRKSRKSRTARSKRRGGDRRDDLEALKSDVSLAMNEDSDDDTTRDLIARAMKLEVELPKEGVVNLDTLYSALKDALLKKSS